MIIRLLLRYEGRPQPTSNSTSDRSNPSKRPYNRHPDSNIDNKQVERRKGGGSRDEPSGMVREATKATRGSQEDTSSLDPQTVGTDSDAHVTPASQDEKSTDADDKEECTPGNS